MKTISGDKMWKVQICLNLLFLSVCAHNIRFFSNFTNKIIYPKCCDVTEAFNINYECINVTESKDYYQVSQINNLNNTKTDLYCIDAIVDEWLTETGVYQRKNYNNLTITLKSAKLEQVLFYPKCCPLSSIYDPKLHRCIPNNNMTSMPLDISSWYIKTGLSQCRDNHVIVDYLLLPNDELILHDNKSINLNGTLHRYGAYCFDKVTEELDVVRVCRPQETTCLISRTKPTAFPNSQNKRFRCIKKCCPDGQSYQRYNGKNTCMSNFKYGVDISHRRFNHETNDKLQDDGAENGDRKEIGMENFAILTPPLVARYLPKDSILFYIDNFGTLFSEEQEELEKFDYNQEKYCVEYHNNVMKFFFSAPANNGMELLANKLYVILLIISIVFITITIIAYVFLPKMLNLHGKITLSHCLSLLLLDILLIILKRTDTPKEICVILGFSTLFSSLSVFCWLNIIGFDIWYNIGSMRVRGMVRKEKEIKKFILYCGYGWLVPLLFTIFAYAAYSFEFLPGWATPHMGDSICYFKQETGTYDYYIFYFAPFNVLLILNLVFFGRTIYYCFKVKAEINKMRNAGDDKGLIKKMFQQDKERATMLFKLLVVMGVTWFFEVIGLVVDTKHAFPVFVLVFDVINALQGFWIFCIYILKRKVYEAVQDTLGIKWGRHVNRGSASDRTTSTVLHSNITHTQLLTSTSTKL